MKYNALFILLLTSATTSALKGADTTADSHKQQAVEALHSANTSHRPSTAALGLGFGATVASGGDQKVISVAYVSLLLASCYSSRQNKAGLTEANTQLGLYNEKKDSAHPVLLVSHNTWWFPEITESTVKED
jgi:hypothetical protein